MPGTAQIFPVVGTSLNLPNPLPTQDAADNTIGSPIGTTTIQVAGKDTNGNVQTIQLGDDGEVIVIGPTLAGTAINAGDAPVLVGGSDGTNARYFATDTTGHVKVIGSLTNNDAAPAAIEVGVLPALANAVAPTWIEGDQVLESVDLSGNQRVVLNTETTKVIGTVNQGTSPWVISGTVTSTLPTNTDTTTGDVITIVTATTTNGAAQTNANARGALVTTILGTVSGTLPTLSLQLQWSPDGGTTWLNYGAATSAIAVATGNTITVVVYPTALALTLGGVGSVQTNAPLPRTWRMTYITTGTGISIAIASVQVNYVL